MTRLLVSVRGAAEVAAALAGGAALIDVKEPAHGPLGRAFEHTISEVIAAVAGRCSVSAAMGEISQGVYYNYLPGCEYLKWGLSGLAQAPPHGRDWRGLLGLAAEVVRRRSPGCQVVTVAYADWQLADAPPVEEVCAFARQRPGGVFLLDTFAKGPRGGGAARPTLLDCLSASKIALLCRLCRAAGVRVALAGSLGRAEVERLLPAEPDWFAVRGAVCAGGDRGGAVEEAKVRELAALLAG